MSAMDLFNGEIEKQIPDKRGYGTKKKKSQTI
jgi:hypothetical protein